ncbi:MAG: ATP-grasp domain-containing protein [Planctomycetota bacterium]|jgi:hypothetical protein
MRIALATCSELPDWEIDDRPLHEAFAARGVEIARPVWDDPDVDWSRFDACLIRTTWDYMEKRDAYIAWAERVESVTPLFNAAAIVRWNTHKRYLFDLAEDGVTVAPTIWLDPGQPADAAALLAERGWPRAFIKPMIGATARETLRFDTDEPGLAAAQTHLDRLLPREGVMIQPYLGRVETEGEISAIFIDGQFTHGVRKVPVSGDYRVQDDFGAHDEPRPFAPTELDLVRGILDRVEGDLVYARADFLRSDDGELLLSELELVEPSLFFRHGPDAAEALVSAVCRRVDSAGS